MKNIILSWLLLMISSFGISQTITIKSKDTGLPIELVKIISLHPKIQTTTNAKGQADLSLFQKSEAIDVLAFGYKKVTLSYDEIVAKKHEIFLESSVIGLDEFVVSASKWGENSSSIPTKISNISAREVALQNPQTAADMLATSGEVFIQKSQQGGGSPMIRGFSTNRLLYTVDGVRMNTAIFRSGNIQNVISLDPLAIENTEVMFGPGSITYGSDAIGGVMCFTTLTPQLSLEDSPLVTGKFTTRYSSANNEKTGHFDVNVGWKKWAIVSSITHSDYGDLRMGTNGPDDYLSTFFVQRIDSLDRVVSNPDPLTQTPTGYEQINMIQKVRFSPNKKWDFQYGFHFSETSEYSRYDRLFEIRSNGLPRSAVWNYGPQKWMMNHLTIRHTSNNKIYDKMKIGLAQQYFEESRIDRNFSGGNRFRLRTQLEQVDAFSTNIDFEKTIGKHEFYYGIEYIQNDITSNGSAIDIRDNSNIPVSDRYPNSQWKSYAAYLNYHFDISKQFILQVGARYNMFDLESDFTRHLEFFPFDFTNTEIQNAATNFSLGGVYRPNESWKISFCASTGFRAPNIDDIGKIFDFAGGEIVVPNTNLSAEYAYNGEVNISKIFGDFVKLDLTGFYTYLDNAMVRRAFQVNGQDSILYDGEMSKVYAIQNAAFGTVYGANIGIEIKLNAEFSISSRYNYQLGEEEMDNGDISRSRHAAPAFGVTRFTYKKNKLFLQTYAMYAAEVSFENLNEEEKQKEYLYAKDANGNPFAPSWFTLNFKAMYQLTNIFSVSAGLENITNQRYRTYSSGLTAPGRNFILSLRGNF